MVHYGRKSRRSGRILRNALRHYEGRPINFGYGVVPDGINSPRAIANASNKRRAFRMLAEAGVPIPEVYEHFYEIEYPCVGRPDRHRGGSGFYLCRNSAEASRALREGATHFMEYIQGGREFRVHIAFGKSIKLAEKMGGDTVIRNFRLGSIFLYPEDFNHKKTLRKVARQAVEALGLDFGAVDIIYKDGKYYVLEVNTAPSLTSQSDTLERYVKAFGRSAYDESKW